jgi:hypothetical protein
VPALDKADGSLAEWLGSGSEELNSAPRADILASRRGGPFPMSLSRRRFFAFTAGAGAIAAAQEAPHPKAPGPGTQWDPRMGVADADRLFQYSGRRPKVALVKGDNRRKNVFNALVGIDDQIQPGLKRKKYVLIKVNGLAPGRNIGSTNLDCVHGILDYLAPRFKGPVVITEGGEATYKQAF